MPDEETVLAESDLEDGEESPAEERESAGARAGRILAAFFGLVTLVGGLTWILINLQAPDPVIDLAAGVVLAIGGLILLMPHRVHLPLRAAWITAGVAAVAGVLTGVVAYSAYACCSFAYAEQRGFPFKWLSHGATAGDADSARRLTEASTWQADVPALAVNAIVWAYLGLMVLALVSGLRRARR